MKVQIGDSHSWYRLKREHEVFGRTINLTKKEMEFFTKVQELFVESQKALYEKVDAEDEGRTYKSSDLEALGKSFYDYYKDKIKKDDFYDIGGVGC